MCKKLAWFSAVLLLGLGSVAIAAEPLRQNPGPDGIVAVEAEHFDQKVTAPDGHGWVQVGPTAGFTGVVGMQALPNVGVKRRDTYATESPRLDFKINFVKTGTHYIWLRAWGAGASDDSCHAGLDNAPASTAHRITGFAGVYTWTNSTAGKAPATLNVGSPGVHTLNIWMSEDGAIIDKIVLTPTLGLTPVGNGPPESPRSAVLTAYYPRPADRQDFVEPGPGPLLSWNAGDKAAAHHVYFGTDPLLVAHADQSAPEYKGLRMLGDETCSLGKLAWAATYYWRVDEVNALDPESPHKGDLWSFTTADFLVIDDFEDYNDAAPDRIFDRWQDGYGVCRPLPVGPPYPPDWRRNGTGSRVGYIHPPFSDQSMPYYYDNDAPGSLKYSEATLTLTWPRDWTADGVRALCLAFRGTANNISEPMYVAISDGGGTTFAVYHPDPDAVLGDGWSEWNIDLAEFSSRGVNLGDVNSLSFGFGDRSQPVAGGEGLVLFDDIRLYRARCVPEVLKPAADLSNDCVVDIADLRAVGGQWLHTGSGLQADLDGDEKVGFKDYCLLAGGWLDEAFWP